MAATSPQSLAARREFLVQAHIEAEADNHDVALATFYYSRYEVSAMGRLPTTRR
jgi:hypothetical protein